MRFIKTAFLACLLFPMITTIFAGESDKQIALSFEKLPYMKPMGFWTPREVSNMVLRTLAPKGIKAIGFVVEEKLEDDPSSYVVLEDWVREEHWLGNNTFAYVDFNEVSARDFLEHVGDGQDSIKRASRFKRKFRYIRYPLLHEGNTESKRKDVSKRLYRADYYNVPVTVKTTDYQFNHFFDEAEADDSVLDRLRQEYLNHISGCLDYAEAQSQAVFGRQIKHILQLHLGVATANFIGELLALLEERGYEFITFEEALEDEAYQTEDLYYGPLGLSFTDRIAATKGIAFDENACLLTRRKLQARMLESATQE